MVKMNFTDDQTAFEYVMYMMLGSYFDKTICRNFLLEKKMRVQYLEQKERKQIEMEDLCIKFVENELLPHLPKKLWNNEVSVRFRALSSQGGHDIQFHSPNYILRVAAVYRGKKKTEIIYELFKLNTEQS